MLWRKQRRLSLRTDLTLSALWRLQQELPIVQGLHLLHSWLLTGHSSQWLNPPTFPTIPFWFTSTLILGDSRLLCSRLKKLKYLENLSFL
jgi:hypothetical protein